MSLTRRLRSYFFDVTNVVRADGTNGGIRFRSTDKPSQTTYEQLFDSLGFIGSTDDTATTSTQGFVKLASDAQVTAGTDTDSSYALVPKPSQMDLNGAYIKGTVDGSARLKNAAAQSTSTAAGATANGSSNEATATDSFTIGNGSKSIHKGEFSHASKYYDAKGDTQGFDVQMTYKGLTDNGEFELLIAGTDRLTFPDNNTLYTIRILVSAVSNYTGDHYYGGDYTFIVYKNKTGTISIVDSVCHEDVAAGDFETSGVNLAVVDSTTISISYAASTAFTSPGTNTVKANADVRVSKVSFPS